MDSVAATWVECFDTSELWAYRYMARGWVWDSQENRFTLYQAIAQAGEFSGTAAAINMAEAADLSWGYAREDEDLEDWVPCDGDDPDAFKATWAVQP